MANPHKRSPQNEEVVQLYLQGKFAKEISEIQGRSYGRVAGVIHAARRAGDIPPSKRGRNNHHNAYNSGVLKDLLRQKQMLVGRFSQSVLKEVDRPVYEWLVDDAHKMGHETMMDYLIDLAIDRYFEGNDKIAHQASRWLNGPLPVDLMADLAAIMEDENYSPEKRAHQIVWQAPKWMMNTPIEDQHND